MSIHSKYFEENIEAGNPTDFLEEKVLYRNYWEWAIQIFPVIRPLKTTEFLKLAQENFGELGKNHEGKMYVLGWYGYKIKNLFYIL